MSRQIAYVLMSYDVILSVAGSQGAQASNLPVDAKVSHVVLLDTSAQARVYFESESLEPVVEGGLIPEFVVHVTDSPT